MVGQESQGIANVNDDVRTPAEVGSALDDLYWQDEILQVMFWLLGEGFAEEVTVASLRRFLDADAAILSRNLEALQQRDLVYPGASQPGAYHLTEIGKVEAQRRFMDEFRPYLGRSGHGECSDDCWCHDPAHEGEPCPSTVHAHEPLGT